MKHLHKAFSTHRLIRSQPDISTADAPSAAADTPDHETSVPHQPLPVSPPHWRRKRPWHSPDSISSNEFARLIALWDEIEDSYDEKV